MKQRGFTVIELMIVIVIFVIVILISAGFAVNVSPNNVVSSGNSISAGINGITESRCIEGYKFVVGQDGNARQILDEFGKGVRCGNGLR